MAKRSLLNFPVFSLVAVGLWVGNAGCGPGGPEVAPVEGSVMMDGEPLPNAAIVFRPPKGPSAGAVTDAHGHYVLNFSSDREGAITGINQVWISTYSKADVDEAGHPISGSRETIPIEYNQESILTFHVEPGRKNVANFYLKSDAKVIDESND